MSKFQETAINILRAWNRIDIRVNFCLRSEFYVPFALLRVLQLANREFYFYYRISSGLCKRLSSSGLAPTKTNYHRNYNNTFYMRQYYSDPGSSPCFPRCFALFLCDVIVQSTLGIYLLQTLPTAVPMGRYARVNSNLAHTSIIENLCAQCSNNPQSLKILLRIELAGVEDDSISYMLRFNSSAVACHFRRTRGTDPAARAQECLVRAHMLCVRHYHLHK